MGQVTLPSMVVNWKKALAANTTQTTAFGSTNATLPTITKPALSVTQAVWELVAQRREENTIQVIPFGGNDNNETNNYRLTGWNFQKESGAFGLWIPSHICTVQATLSSTLVGVAGEDEVVADLFCDGLSLTNGIAILHTGTADADVAWFEADVSGFQVVVMTFDLGSSDDANALVRFNT